MAARLWGVLAVALVVGTGCGRRNFDAVTDGGLAGDADNDAGDDAADAGPAPFNVVFVTSTTHVPGEFGGTAAADSICQGLADNAGLTGTYVAWLSTSTVDARARLAGARGWVRTDGRPVVDRVDDLIEGRMFFPIRLDENGDDVKAAGPLVATGTHASGATASNNCVDYADVASKVEVGAHYRTTESYGSNSEELCSVPLRLYCFGVDKSEPVTVSPAPGRIAFVTLAPFLIGSGLAGADAQCANEAATAGLPGTYLALLATSNGSAASRFDVNGPTWVRTDGVPLADSALDFMGGKLLSSLNATVVETYYSGDVWTGAADPFAVGDTTSSCSEWVNTAVTGTAGEANTTAPAFFEGLTGISCTSTDNRLLCLQE